MLVETRITNEIEDKNVTITWDEVYLDLIQVPARLVTRARAKKFKEVINELI